MLDIDKSTVDFLVTENMVQEVEKVLSHDVPLVHAIVEEMVKRDIDRIYFVACGSPLNAAQTAKHLADRFSDLQVYAISGWEFCDNTPYRLDDRCAVIGVSDYGKTEEVIKALELGRACGALTAAFTKRADSPITSAAEFSIDYQADCIWEIHLLVGWRSILGCLKHEKNSVQALCGAGLRGFHGFWTILGKMLKNAFFCALFWTLLIRFWRDFNILCVCLI